MKKNHHALGTVLRKNRMNAGISIHEVAKITNIKVEYLVIIENEQWHQLPSFAYALRFVRVYAKYLGIDYRPYLEDIRKAIQKTQKTDIVKYQRKNNIIAMVSVALMIISVVLIIFAVKNSIEQKPEQQKIAKTENNTQKIINIQNIERKIIQEKVVQEEITQEEIIQKEVKQQKIVQNKITQQKQQEQKINQGDLPQIFVTKNIDIANLSQYQNKIASVNDDIPNLGFFIKAIDEVWVRIEENDGKIIFSDTLKIGQVIQLPKKKQGILITTDNLDKIIFKKNGKIINKILEKKGIVIELNIDEIT